MRKFLTIAAVMMLGACANNPTTGTVQASVDKLVNADAIAALQDAQSHNDLLAIACYQKIVDITTPSPTDTTVAVGKPGVLYLMQKGRDLKADTSNNQRLKGLNVACAPLVFSDQATLIQLIAPIGLIP